MAYTEDAIAIGIGPQPGGLGVPNPFVVAADNLIDGPAAGTDATGILLRNPEDLSKSFERIESDGGVVPGSLSRLSGVLSRVKPVVSFTVDIRGNGDVVSTPTQSGDYDPQVYLNELYEGARLTATPAASNTKYLFQTGTLYKTLKIWRGITAAGGATGESWVLSDCTFTLSFAFTAAEVPDSNVTGGITSLIGTPRSVNFSGTFYVDDGSQDYELLRNELTGALTTNESNLQFLLGALALVNGDIIEAIKFQIPTLRVTGTDKVDGEANRVLRTISGYGVIAQVAAGDGAAANEELSIAFF